MSRPSFTRLSAGRDLDLGGRERAGKAGKTAASAKSPTEKNFVFFHMLLLLHVHRTLFAEKRESVAVFTLKMALDTISLSQLS